MYLCGRLTLKTIIMIRFVTLLLFLLPLHKLAAQDSYRPLLKDGKTWELLGRAANFEEVRLTQYVDGDTIVDGEHYYKMYTRMAVANTGEVITVSGPILMQEEGGRVWELRNDTKGNMTRWLLYDFGLSVGDTFTSMGSDVVRLTAIDNIKVGEQLFRRFTFGVVDDGLAAPIYWVEGVGSLHGPMESVVYGQVGVSYKLRACYEDGACIFTGDDFSAPSYHSEETEYSGLSKLPMSEKRHSPTFDLQGRHLSCPPENGVYIRDGRNVIR